MACVADHRFKPALGTALVATVLLCLSGCDGRDENGELLSRSQVDAEKEISSTLTYATLTNKIISDIDRDPDAWPEKRKHLLLMELVYLLELQTTPPTDELVEAAGPSMVHLHGSNALGLLGVSSHDELTDVAESAEMLPKHKAVFTDEKHAQYGPLKALVEDCLKFDISQLD